MHTGTHTHISAPDPINSYLHFCLQELPTLEAAAAAVISKEKVHQFSIFSVSHAICVRQVVTVAAALFYSSMSRNHNPLHHNWYRNGMNFISSENPDFINQVLSNMCEKLIVEW